jgi:AcrR family transcriptional regulator
MPIPPRREETWNELDSEAKRSCLLRAAGEVFARDGLQAPMPAVAAAAEAGVGSVYRQFPSKEELLAALVVERLGEVEGDALAALQGPEPPRAALIALLRAYVERQAEDDLVGEAMACVSAHPGVERALAETTIALEALLAAAKPEGLRADATTLDLRLLFASTRAANRLEAGSWQRMLELGLDALFGRAGAGR